MKQIKVAITDETKAYLDDEARRNGRNLSEEVRVRIEQSQVDDRFDALTKELGRDVMWLAHQVARGAQAASWMSDLARQRNFPQITESARQEVEKLVAANARGYAEIKPLLIKHRPGGDNMEDMP